MRTLLLGLLQAVALIGINSQTSEDRDSFVTASVVETMANSEWEDGKMEELPVKERSSPDLNRSKFNMRVENIDHLLPVDASFGSRAPPKIQRKHSTVPPGISTAIMKAVTEHSAKKPFHGSDMETTAVLTASPTTTKPVTTSTTCGTTSTTPSKPTSLAATESTRITDT